MPQLLRKVPRPPACSICVRDDIWKVVGATLTSFFERSALKVNPVLLVHGGAWAIPDEMVEAHLAGARAAIAAGWTVLEKGSSALDAVEEAVVIMEDDDSFDAGRGSFLNRNQAEKTEGERAWKAPSSVRAAVLGSRRYAN